MKRILVPVDFSTCANAALAVAMQLAKKASGEIFLLHLYLDLADEPHVPHRELADEAGHQQNPTLGKIKNDFEMMVAKARSLDIPATPILIYSKGQERIEDYIETYNIDFIVMGSHGVRGVKETFLGSNTQRLIRRSPVPVLVIKEHPKDFGIKKIVYMSSFEEDSINSFETVKAIAKLWDAEIYLLYVNTPYHFKETNESLFDIKRFMHQFPKVAYTPVIYDALDEERGLEEFIRQNKIDLIALGTHGKRGLLRLVSHGIAESIINHQGKPVLVMNMSILAEKIPSLRHALSTKEE